MKKPDGFIFKLDGRGQLSISVRKKKKVVEILNVQATEFDIFIDQAIAGNIIANLEQKSKKEKNKLRDKFLNGFYIFRHDKIKNPPKPDSRRY
jgi:hypothetical protein